jgi:aspartate-semialdehyde dehydrogenase
VYGLLLEALPNCRPRQLASALQGVAQLQLYNEQLVGSIMQVSGAGRSSSRASW